MRPVHDTNFSLTDLVLESVEDRKGVDPLALDVTALTDITDTMVTSNRHVKAIVDNVLEVTKAHGIKVLGVEGRTENHWVLIDLADVVVHVMRAEARAFYDLERLWEQPGALRSTPAATPPGPA